MKTLLLVLCTFSTLQAFAANETRIELKGKDAYEMYDSISSGLFGSQNVQVGTIVGNRTGSLQAKICRSTSGLTQISCQRTYEVYDQNPKQESIKKSLCIIENSVDGKPLPAYRPY
jgi:hypothetical protein